MKGQSTIRAASSGSFVYPVAHLEKEKAADILSMNKVVVNKNSRQNSRTSAYDASIESVSVSKRSQLAPLKHVALDNLVLVKQISQGKHSRVSKYVDTKSNNQYVVKELYFQE